jgi:hypothetical protein
VGVSMENLDGLGVSLVKAFKHRKSEGESRTFESVDSGQDAVSGVGE